jgi:ribose transport system substrate-binding protein
VPDDVAFWGSIRASVTPWGIGLRRVRTGAFMGLRILADRVPVPGNYLANSRPSSSSRMAPSPETWRGALPRPYGDGDHVRAWSGTAVRVRAAAAHPVSNGRAEAGASCSSFRGEPRRQLGDLMYESHASYGRCGLGSTGHRSSRRARARRRPRGRPVRRANYWRRQRRQRGCRGRHDAAPAIARVADAYERQTGYRPAGFCRIVAGSGGIRPPFDHGVNEEQKLMQVHHVARLIAGLVCVAFLAAGCQSRESPAAGGRKTVKIAFVTNNSADFWTIARRGVEKADQELADVEAEFRLTADGTAAEQQRVVDDLLTKGVDAIAISPVDPQNQTALINAAARQAIVFTQDSDAPESARACYIGTDNLAAGRQAGQLIREAIPEGGTIMLFVGRLDARNAQERVQGIKEALAGSNVRILDVRTDDADDVRAKANAADTLVRYPDIKGMVGLWSYNGPAILNAVRDAGKTGRVRIITFDEADETLAGIKAGDIHATVVQQPYEFGYQAITKLAQAVRGDRSFIPASKQIIVPTLVVNRANVDEFTQRIKTLRGR